MGVVYRAYDLRLKRTVALKLIAPGLALDERFRERFARETELAMSLEHPNVVPIYDAGDVDGRLYLAMRLVDSDLRKLLRTEGGLEPARAIAICRQVASALDAAHSRGLVHRDVKPSNVLLDDHEHAYLADFGLTRRLDEPAPLGTDDRSIGTPAYLAPEQLEGTPVDGRADVYALGCVLFECLTSAPPYLRASRLEIAWAHLEEEPPRASKQRPGLPEAIDRVVSRAMAKDPQQRYPTCDALVTAAESALRLRRSAPPVRRRTAVLVAAVLLVLLAAAGAIVALLAPHTPQPLYAGVNTVARIDPGTNKVANVIRVGRSPGAIAAGGHSVWVYNRRDSSISEIDARTNTVRNTTDVPGLSAGCCSHFAGPVLAADASGAWFVSGDAHQGAWLTRLQADAGGKNRYPLDLTPTGVAVGDGYVWVVGHAAHDYRVLQIDPATGQVQRRARFAETARIGAAGHRHSVDPLIQSITVAFGYVWVVGSHDGTLYRIDAGTATRDGQRVLRKGSPPDTRPEATSSIPGIPDYVNVGYRTKNGSTAAVNPVNLHAQDDHCGCQPGWGDTFTAFGSLWFSNWQTGDVARGWSHSGSGPIEVTATTPSFGGPCLVSMTPGAGSTWVIVGPPENHYYGCSG
jgi:hypothetical protein